MKDKSIPVILVVVVLSILALVTGLRREPIPERWLEWSHPSSPSSPSSASRPGSPDRPESRTIEADGAERADVSIRQGAGILTLSGGTSDLAELEFDVGSRAWLPRVDYSVEGSTGVLAVIQGEMRGFPRGDHDNTWDIELSDTTPLELDVELGAGEADIDLSDVLLESLEAKLGAGEFAIDLTGDRADDVDVDIVSGVGELTMRLPEDVSVKVVVDSGIGDFTAEGFEETDRDTYVNDAYDEDEPTITVRIVQGIGEIKLELVR